MIEEPQPAQLEQLLVAQMPDARVASVTNFTRVFGGNARRAYAFDVTVGDGDGTSQMEAIVLSQVERGQVDSDAAREYRVLRGLNGRGVRAPGALAVDEKGEVVGSPSVVLERMPGAASVSGFLEPADPECSRALSDDLARATAELHSADWSTTGLADGAPVADPRAVAAAQVDYWHELFEGCRMEPHPALASVYGWLGEHVPEPRRLSLVHGDLRVGNFLTVGPRITALLDWEMAHLGDPAEDIAWIYRPLWSPEGFLALDDFLAVYDEHATAPADGDAVRYWRIFSEAKFATISLRAARAFHDGTSTNLRLIDRAAMVTDCVRGALDWIAEDGRA